MKIANVISSIKIGAGRAACRVKAHSPELLLVIGVAGIVGGTILACRATLKAHKIIEEAQIGLKEIHDCETDEGLADKYTEEDAKNDKIHLFVKTAARMTGLYAPSVLLCGCSIAAILLSHRIMSDRTAQAIAFGNTAAAALAEYRNEVVEKWGREADENIRYGLKRVKSTDAKLYSETDGGGGSLEQEETCVEIGDASPYAVMIDKECDIWDRSSDLTIMNLHSALNYLNNTLQARATGKCPGYLFLYEVLDYLGIPRERWPKDSTIVGWLYDKSDLSLHNYIDFGPMYLMTPRELGNGTCYIREDGGTGLRERNVIVDFNIDGIIYDKI